MKSFRRSIQQFNTPSSIESYQEYLDSFNWNKFLSENYDPFLDEIHRHILFLAQNNGQKWMEKYSKTREKYLKMNKK